jgi:hypothetical protein
MCLKYPSKSNKSHYRLYAISESLRTAILLKHKNQRRRKNKSSFLIPAGNFVQIGLVLKNSRSVDIIHSCVSQTKQRLFPYTALNDTLLYPKRNMFPYATLNDTLLHPKRNMFPYTELNDTLFYPKRNMLTAR